MSATGLLLFLIGAWIIINSPNLVGVIKGELDLGVTKPVAKTGTPSPVLPPGHTA